MSVRVNANVRPGSMHSPSFKDYEDDVAINRSMERFLIKVWSGAPSDSHFFLATTDPYGRNWRDHIFNETNLSSSLREFFSEYSRWEYNLYFCPNPFSLDRRKREFARPSRLGWCDMDESDPFAYRPKASCIWETSPKRFQSLWLWDGWHGVEEAEGFSQSLAAKFGGDTGWSVTKMLRIPGSVNHKAQYDEPIVRLVRINWKEISDRPLIQRCARSSEVNEYANPDLLCPNKVFEKYRKKLHLKARALIRHTRVIEKDRSSCIYFLIASLRKAGASRNEIATVLWHSPYFIEKHGQDVSKLNDELSRVISKLEGGR
jgi:RepB DNA-primase N-terminal domain